MSAIAGPSSSRIAPPSAATPKSSSPSMDPKYEKAARMIIEKMICFFSCESTYCQVNKIQASTDTIKVGTEKDIRLLRKSELQKEIKPDLGEKIKLISNNSQDTNDYKIISQLAAFILIKENKRIVLQTLLLIDGTPLTEENLSTKLTISRCLLLRQFTVNAMGK
jgi:hypothetical protein